MHTTVHLCDEGIGSLPRRRRAASLLRKSPGRRWSLVMTPAPLGSGIPRPQLGRFALVAFWDDRATAAEALAGTPFGDDFDGLRLDLEPVRAVGGWTGLPTDLPTDPAEAHAGPAVVITLGRLRLLQARRFFAASAKAEKQLLASPGITWATGLAAPERRTVMTLSWWHDQDTMDSAIRGPGHHRDAMRGQAEKDFHHASAFVRFRPVAASGSLSGRNGITGLAAS